MYFIFYMHPLFAQSESKYIRDGNQFYQNKKYELAAKSYNQSLQKNKDNFDAQFNLGDALYKQDKFDDAAHIFESLKEKTKDKTKLFQTYHNLGNALLSNKKYEESVKAYKNALKLNPKDEDTRYNLAYALKKMEQQKNQNQKNQNQKNQDQQKQSESSQNQDKKNEKKDKQEKQSTAQQSPQMNKEDAKRILEAMNNQEKNIQDKLKKKKAVKVTIEKDW